MGAGVAAHVEQDRGVHGQDGAVLPQPQPHPVGLLPRLVRRLEVLRAVLDPAHRPAEMHGGERHQEVLGIELAARAEPSPDRRLDEVDGTLGQAAQLRQDAPVGVGHLGGTPHGEHVADFVVLRHQAACLQRHRGVTLGLEGFLDDEVALGERAVHVAHVHLEVGGDVARHLLVEPGGVRRHGRAGAGHRREVLVDHLHQLERVLGDVAVLGHHHRHRIAHVAHPIRGDGRLLGAFKPLHDPGTHGNGLESRQVRGRDHPHDPGQGQGGGGVNGGHPGVGAGAAENGGVHHAGPPDIAHVLAGAPQERHVLPALYARTDVGHGRSSTFATLPSRPREWPSRCSRSRCSGTGCRSTTRGSRCRTDRDSRATAPAR